MGVHFDYILNAQGSMEGTKMAHYFVSATNVLATGLIYIRGEHRSCLRPLAEASTDCGMNLPGTTSPAFQGHHFKHQPFFPIPHRQVSKAPRRLTTGCGESSATESCRLPQSIGWALPAKYAFTRRNASILTALRAPRDP